MCDDHITHHHCLENTVKRLWVFVSFIIDNEPPILLLWKTWKLHRVMVVQLFSWVPNIWHSFNNALYYPSFIPSVSVGGGVSGRGKIRPITASAASQRSWTAFWRRLEMCSGKKKKSATKKLRPFLKPNPNQTFLKVITCSEVSFHYFSLIQSSALPGPN